MQSNQKGLVNVSPKILNLFEEYYKDQWYYIDTYGETPTGDVVPSLTDIMYLIAADLIIRKDVCKDSDLLNDILNIVFTHHIFSMDVNYKIRFNPIRKVW